MIDQSRKLAFLLNHNIDFIFENISILSQDDCGIRTHLQRLATIDSIDQKWSLFRSKNSFWLESRREYRNETGGKNHKIKKKKKIWSPPITRPVYLLFYFGFVILSSASIDLFSDIISLVTFAFNALIQLYSRFSLIFFSLKSCEFLFKFLYFEWEIFDSSFSSLITASFILVSLMPLFDLLRDYNWIFNERKFKPSILILLSLLDLTMVWLWRYISQAIWFSFNEESYSENIENIGLEQFRGMLMISPLFVFLTV